MSFPDLFESADQRLRAHDLRLVWRDWDFRLLSVRTDAVGISVQMHGERSSEPFPPGCVQVGASTSTAACRAPPARHGEETARTGARRNERRGGIVSSGLRRTYGIRGYTGHDGCNGFRAAAIQAGSPGVER